MKNYNINNNIKNFRLKKDSPKFKNSENESLKEHTNKKYLYTRSPKSFK